MGLQRVKHDWGTDTFIFLPTMKHTVRETETVAGSQLDIMLLTKGHLSKLRRHVNYYKWNVEATSI